MNKKNNIYITKNNEINTYYLLKNNKSLVTSFKKIDYRKKKIDYLYNNIMNTKNKNKYSHLIKKIKNLKKQLNVINQKTFSKKYLFNINLLKQNTVNKFKEKNIISLFKYRTKKHKNKYLNKMFNNITNIKKNIFYLFFIKKMIKNIKKNKKKRKKIKKLINKLSKKKNKYYNRTKWFNFNKNIYKDPYSLRKFTGRFLFNKQEDIKKNKKKNIYFFIKNYKIKKYKIFKSIPKKYKKKNIYINHIYKKKNITNCDSKKKIYRYIRLLKRIKNRISKIYTEKILNNKKNIYFFFSYMYFNLILIPLFKLGVSNIKKKINKLIGLKMAKQWKKDNYFYKKKLSSLKIKNNIYIKKIAKNNINKYKKILYKKKNLFNFKYNFLKNINYKKNKLLKLNTKSKIIINTKKNIKHKNLLLLNLKFNNDLLNHTVIKWKKYNKKINRKKKYNINLFKKYKNINFKISKINYIIQNNTIKNNKQINLYKIVKKLNNILLTTKKNILFNKSSTNILKNKNNNNVFYEITTRKYNISINNRITKVYENTLSHLLVEYEKKINILKNKMKKNNNIKINLLFLYYIKITNLLKNTDIYSKKNIFITNYKKIKTNLQDLINNYVVKNYIYTYSKFKKKIQYKFINKTYKKHLFYKKKKFKKINVKKNLNFIKKKLKQIILYNNYNMNSLPIYIYSHITTKNMRYLISDNKHKILRSISLGNIGVSRKYMRIKKYKLKLAENFLKDIKFLLLKYKKKKRIKFNELVFNILRHKRYSYIMFKELKKFIRKRLRKYEKKKLKHFNKKFKLFKRNLFYSNRKLKNHKKYRRLKKKQLYIQLKNNK